jgi:hypothetical protein
MNLQWLRGWKIHPGLAVISLIIELQLVELVSFHKVVPPLSIAISTIKPSYWSYKPTELTMGHHLAASHV